jgi:hypothetical protein
MISLVPCRGTEIVHHAIQKIESFSWSSTLVCAGNAFRCECLSDRSGGEIAEQPIG